VAGRVQISKDRKKESYKKTVGVFQMAAALND
jgi:hypothetical protein